MTFWHFTCSHSLPGIQRDGLLYPASRLWKPEVSAGLLPLSDLVWLTDLDAPADWEIGLSRAGGVLTRCNRLEHRLAVPEHPAIRPWLRVAKELGISRDVLRLLHEAPAKPGRWYVSAEPVPVLLTPAGD